MAEDQDRSTPGLGIPTEPVYQCTCGAISTVPSCPVQGCQGTVTAHS